MSDLERHLIDLYNQLDSNKIKDRKKSFEELKQILQESNYTSLIDKNSTVKNKGGVNWNQLFISAHNGAIKEAELCLTEKSERKIFGVKNFISIILELVAKANSEVPRLLCSNIVSCILEASETPHNRRLFSEGYSRMLHDHVLSCKKYWSELTLLQWIDLQKLCQLLLEEANSDKMKCTLVSCLNFVCLHGSHITKFLPHIHNLLKELPNFLSQMSTSQMPGLQLSVIQLSLTICKRIKEEYRYSVCKFGEIACPYLITLYESRDVINKKELIAQLLIEIVEVHHPCGVASNSPGALAFSWDDWTSQLKTLYKTLEDEIFSILNSKNVLSPYIVHLAVICAKQVFSENYAKQFGSQESIDFSFDTPSTSKRRRLNSGIDFLISTVQTKPIADVAPLLIFLEALMERYPEMFTEEDFLKLLQYTSEKLPICTLTVVTNQLCRIAVQLVNLEEVLIDKTEGYEKEIQNLWLNIWNTAINFLHFSKEIGLKQPSEETHPLVRALIRKGFQTFMADSLLKLYLTGVLPFAEESLKTFICLCQNGVISETPEVRKKLLEWLIINRVLDDCSSAVLCGQAMFALLLKSKFPSDEKIVPSPKWRESELYFLSTSLEQLPKTIVQSKENNCNALIEYPQFLKETIQKLKEKEEEFIGMNDPLVALPHATALVVLTSLALQHKISGSEEIKKLLDNCLELLWPFLTNQLKESREEVMNELLIAANIFFQEIVKQPSYVNNRNVEKMAQHVFVFFIQDYKSSTTNSMLTPSQKFAFDGFEEVKKVNYEDVPLIQLNSLKLILNLAMINSTCNGNYCIEDYLFTVCNDTIQPTTLKGFKIILMVLNTILARKKLPNNILTKVLLLVRDLYSSRFKHHEELIVILKMTMNVIPHVYDSNDIDHHEDLCSLISTCSKVIIEKKDYGPEIMKHFVDVLISMVKTDRNNKWKIEHAGNGINLPTALQILEFFKSPSNQVRFKAIEHIPIIFKNEVVSQDLMEIQMEAFTRLMEAVSDLFTVKGGLPEEDIEEEALKRSCCALKIIATIITNSYVWRRKALFKLSTLVSSKNIQRTLIQRILNQIQVDMNLSNVTMLLEQNLDHIVLSCLMGCISRTDFFTDYKQFLVPIVISKKDKAELDFLALSINMDRSTLVQECFPEVVSCLLPKFSPATETMQQTLSIHAFIEQIIGSHKFQELLTEKFEKVLVCIFSKLHDLHYFNQLCGDDHSVAFPEKTSLNIDYEGICAALSYLQKTSPDPNRELLVLLALEHPLHIHNTMHTLFTYITVATCDEIRALALSQYIAFCYELLKNITQIKRTGGYVIRQVIHVLLMMSKSELAIPVLHYMYRIITVSLPHCAIVFNDLLTHIVPTLVAFVKQNPTKDEIAMQILEHLLIKCRSMFTSVENLDPLPNSDVFLTLKKSQNTKDSLKDVIKNFLAAGSQNLDPSYRTEGLEHLCQQLIVKKDELAKFYEELRMSRGLSEDCAQSLLHRLIISLIQLTTSNNSEITKCAAQCLGEIGPCNLTTLVLKPESQSQPPSFCSKVISLLIPLLVNNDPELVSSTASALIALMKTKEGHQVKDSLQRTEKCYISPFVSKSSKQKSSYCVEMHEQKLKESLHLWCPDYIYLLHAEWVRGLTSSILNAFTKEESFLRLLIPIVDTQVHIAEELLPYLVYMILKHQENFISQIEHKINDFFKKHFNMAHGIGTQVEDTKSVNIYMNRASIQCMLRVINFYRQQEAMSEIKLSKKLGLDYLYIAQAAQFCKAYFTSILYAELWAEQILSDFQIPEDLSNLSPLEKISQYKPEEAIILQKLLWEGYKEIGEFDAVYGCGDIHLVETSGRIKFYSQMGLWSKVIEQCELSQDPAFTQDLVDALRMSGKFTIAKQVANDKSDYECAWRLGDWSLNLPKEENYSGLLYGALKAIHNQDKITACQLVDSARVLVVNSVEHASLEVANNIYQPLSRLRALRELEVSCENNGELQWKNEENGRWVDFEPIYYQRGMLMDRKVLPEVWLNLAKKATKFESYLIAQRWLESIEKLNPRKDVLDKVYLQKAQLAWKTGDSLRAKYLIKKVMDEQNYTESSLLSQALLTYGTWMAESKSEQASVIIQKYFEKARSVSERNRKERLAAADCLAKYADSEYQRLIQYFNSKEFSEKCENARVSQKMLAELQKGKADSVDYIRVTKTYEVQVELVNEEMKTLKKEIHTYLILALTEYINCLILGEGDSNDLKMFRVVSLWLGLSDTQHKTLENEINRFMQKINSHKFILILSQLAARISDEKSAFTSVLNSILIRCCKEHPYHSVPIILALANSYKDVDYLQREKNISSKASSSTSKENSKPRVRGALQIYEELLKDKNICEIVLKMQELSLAYISLANCDIPRSMRPGDYKIATGEPIRKLKCLNILPCLSMSIPVNKLGNYSNIVSIQGFAEVYTLVGGVNQPKKVSCICSDGVTRYQLIKGKDDLRQDAVMQQVFTVMNILLRSEESTANRKLLIRTYKVVPLSQRSGLIEWVDNTEPIGVYLAGNNYRQGAHKRYYPKDLSTLECRQRMRDVANKKADIKLKVFNEICSKLNPVFRYFFTEKYPTPTQWFESRLAYTRSVATNSMIGYILGIGDRHVCNILMDLKTAEVIHIDFGIAFEQARILPTPETVPFRLTRDIVDGMGVTGVEGVFRRCCEETLKVLRKCQEPILTTLEVLLYDPLYTWTITPKKAQTFQSEDGSNSTTIDSEEKSSEELNALAMWALQRLKQKLEGREGGGATGVEGQVNYLINTATDPANLSGLFQGWQAYL
ncbi:serine-protein kinase ATM-like isoform X2 [Cimex lectularius]|uniref:non-specific serine/threonine protein kinase n=1 Tax=Cimex lectularius TaxID=79782 RepID=A0A8I6SMP1_CIMLE|nr:serine-protein kinase ATM-like isoform X2 [Cimex lectularius]